MKKLSFVKETLASLDPRQVGEVQAGIIYTAGPCYTHFPNLCRPSVLTCPPPPRTVLCP